MALEYTDSFEHYVTSQVLQKWNFNRGWSAGWSISAASALGTAATGLRTSSIDVGRVLPSGTRKIVGVRFNIRTNGNQADFIKFVNAAGVTLNSLSWTQSSGFLAAKRGSGGTVLATATTGSFAFNTSHYLEIDYSPDPTAGVYTVWLDNVQILNPTGNTGTGGPIAGIVLGQATQFNSIDWSDLYVLNTTGNAPTSRLGPKNIRAYAMGSAGARAAFAPFGAASRLAAINKALADVTTYNYDNVVNDRDNFVPASISTITPVAAMIWAYARQSNLGQRNIGLTLESGATDTIGASQALTQLPLFYGQDVSVDPNTSAIVTLANLNTYKLGYKILL